MLLDDFSLWSVDKHLQVSAVWNTGARRSLVRLTKPDTAPTGNTSTRGTSPRKLILGGEDKLTCAQLKSQRSHDRWVTVIFGCIVNKALCIYWFKCGSMFPLMNIWSVVFLTLGIAVKYFLLSVCKDTSHGCHMHWLKFSWHLHLPQEVFYKGNITGSKFHILIAIHLPTGAQDGFMIQ